MAANGTVYAAQKCGLSKANLASKKLETTNILLLKTFLKIYLESLGMRFNNPMIPTYAGMYGNRFLSRL